MVERQAKWRKRMAKLAPQIGYLEAIRDALGEDGMLVEEVTQMGFAARLLYPVYKPRTFISPGFQDSLGWGYATALGVQDALRDKPVVAISGDGGFMFTATEMATAMHHRIPLTVVVFRDDAFGNVRRIQEERYGNRLIASDLTNPDFVRFAESFGAAAERARNPQELRAALNRALKRRDQPTLIEVPVGPLPSPWEFLAPAARAGLTILRVPSLCPGRSAARAKRSGALLTRDPGFFKENSNRGPGSAVHHYVLHRVRDTQSNYTSCVRTSTTATRPFSTSATASLNAPANSAGSKIGPLVHAP